MPEPSPQFQDGSRGGEREGASGPALLAFLSFFLLAGLGTWLFSAHRLSESPGEGGQPVVFSHRVHVEGQELECSFCHAFYQTETFSGVPGREVCLLCHDEAQGESEEERRLVNLLDEGAPLPWQPVFRQPPHVFFSHRRHAAIAAIECQVCHGDIGSSDTLPDRPDPLLMEECIACHGLFNAPVDCTTCHR